MTVKNILVPLDGSGLAERALPYAAELARTIGAFLTLVRTTDVHPWPHVVAYQLQAQGLLVDTAVAPGEGPRALLSELERRQPDLVVMSTHGRSGIDRLVHGSVAHDVVSHVECPVMLVRADPESDTPAGPRLAGKRVVVPLDGSSFAESALPLAVDLARAIGSDVVLVQAVVPAYQVPADLAFVAPPSMDQALSLVDAEDAATEYLNAVAERLSQSERLRVTGLARVGYLTDLIHDLNAVRPISLVVMSTHGRTGMARALLGEEPDSVLRHDDLPVVLVRPHAAEPLRVEGDTPAMAAASIGKDPSTFIRSE